MKDLRFTYFKPKSMKSAFVATIVQVILMVTVIICTVYMYNQAASGGWIYIVGGLVVAFAVYSMSDNVLQRVLGTGHLIIISDNELAIVNTSSQETLAQGKLGQFGLDTKPSTLKGGNVKHINIKRKDFEFTILETWVKSHDKDMGEFLKWHEKIGRK